MEHNNMEFKETRLYKAIVEEDFRKVASKVRELVDMGRDVTIRDDNKDSYLHVLADHAEKFTSRRSIPAVYQLCLAGIDLNLQDKEGNTCLHKVVQKKGMYRIISALLRCGADVTIKNKDGKTPEDILNDQETLGWQQNLHWFKKYTPTLSQCLSMEKPDVKEIEKLLKSWVRVYNTATAKHKESYTAMAKQVGCSQEIVVKLRKHEYQNEFLLHVLAGSVKKMKGFLKRGVIDLEATDMSYQASPLASPNVPLPLLVHAWGQDNYEVVDLLMEYDIDSARLFVDQKGADPRPLFFFMLNGHPQPNNLEIRHRILRSSNLQRKNSQGQTILFEIISQDLGGDFFKHVIEYGVDIANRDNMGRTARDFANELGQDMYVKVIDGYVRECIKKKDMEMLENLCLKGYDHIKDTLNDQDEKVQRLCEKIKEDRLMKEVNGYLKDIQRVQNQIRQFFDFIERGKFLLAKRLSEGSIAKGQDRCGRTVLHRALLTQQRNIIDFVLTNFSFVLETPDNMLRTPLHYAYLFYGEDSEVVIKLKELAVKEDVTDVRGRKPTDYDKLELSTYDYNKLLKEVTEFGSKVHLRDIHFDEQFSRLIEEGDLVEVKKLVEVAKDHLDMDNYNMLLFKCIEHQQPEIALFLIKAGCDPDIWMHNPDFKTEDIALNDISKVPMVSLEGSATKHGYNKLAKQIHSIKNKKLYGKRKGPRAVPPFEEIANFGAV